MRSICREGENKYVIPIVMGGTKRLGEFEGG